MAHFYKKTMLDAGNGCASVGSAVASNTGGPWFKSSHWQTLCYLFTVNCIEKTKMKEKTAGIGQIFKQCLLRLWEVATKLIFLALRNPGFVGFTKCINFGNLQNDLIGKHRIGKSTI